MELKTTANRQMRPPPAAEHACRWLWVSSLNHSEFSILHSPSGGFTVALRWLWVALPG
jgi:hypothetical protein